MKKMVLVICALLSGCGPLMQQYGVHGDRCDGCGRVHHPEGPEPEGEDAALYVIGVGGAIMLGWLILHGHGQDAAQPDSIVLPR